MRQKAVSRNRLITVIGCAVVSFSHDVGPPRPTRLVLWIGLAKSQRAACVAALIMVSFDDMLPK